MQDPKAGGPKEPKGENFMKGLAKMLTDPAMKKSMRSQQLIGIRMLYSDLAKQLGLSPQENEQQVAGHELDPWRPSDLPAWDHPSVPGATQTLPHRDGTDGFFIARLRRG